MSDKLKIMQRKVIGSGWPNDEDELEAAIQRQIDMVEFLCDIEEQIPDWELEIYERELRGERHAYLNS